MSFKPFRKVAVLGAGVMGAQIAAHLANTGASVLLLDIAVKEGKNKNAVVEQAFKRAQKLNPQPFFTPDVAKRIKLGNFEEDFYRIGEAEWVIEVVIENMTIKQKVMAQIEEHAHPEAIISSNTSGLPIQQITEGRSDAFKSRFLGTHFFNPPRYLKLLELIPTPDTATEVLEHISWFGRVHLGKGIVVAKDTPNFIGNRVGVYAMLRAVQALDDGYTIEEIDALTGTLIGRPKSATFRTADVVGLDTLKHVTENLYNAIEHDESRAIFKVPNIIDKLLTNGQLGAKTGAGVYKKVGKEIHSINLETGAYEPAKPLSIGDLGKFYKAGNLPARIQMLFEDNSKVGDFFRSTTLDILAYCARRIPEISDNPADLDRALCWGFGWEVGPFQTWDYIGFDKVYNALNDASIPLPTWVHEMKEKGIPSFYRTHEKGTEIYQPNKGYVLEKQPLDVVALPLIKIDAHRILWKNDEANLLDLGDGVALYEFQSKSNSLGTSVIQGLNEVLYMVENNSDIRGLVIGNQGKNFSVGANLGEVAMGVMMEAWDTIDAMIAGFQNTIQRVHYATKPVVVAPHQRTLGGGCEMTMASPIPVLSSETYMGLVELGVGLIPAGTGTMRFVAYASERASTDFPSDITTLLRQYFETIAMAKVALSGKEAIALGFVPPHATIVMNDDRRLYVAKEEVIRCSNQGYLPPATREHITVLGKPAKALFEAALHQFHESRYISEYDKYLGSKLAHVLSGGDFSGPTEVHENYLLELEREVFLSLLGEPKTQARIESILTTNKPLRN